MASNHSSVKSPTGSGLGRGKSFACRHNTGSRFNTVFTQLNLEIKSRKCFECQTDTPDNAIKLIEFMTETADLENADPNIVRTAAQLLFERLAGQRKNISTGFKERWSQILIVFSTLCYRRVPVQDLGKVCQNVKLRYGAGVDRELLRALVEAAARHNQIWDLVEPANSPLYASINAFVNMVRGKVGSVESFPQVQTMFQVVEQLGRLSDETYSTLSVVKTQLDRITAK
ncbi:hypothetical protein GGR57DRAFT_509606 [Xylariaceae sp. FL1272]|nr:hypothetical protein GGR57DRAFT_509606 [Xylariaceae sp. FL1272]